MEMLLLRGENLVSSLGHDAALWILSLKVLLHDSLCTSLLGIVLDTLNMSHT